MYKGLVEAHLPHPEADWTEDAPRVRSLPLAHLPHPEVDWTRDAPRVHSLPSPGDFKAGLSGNKSSDWAHLCSLSWLPTFPRSPPAPLGKHGRHQLCRWKCGQKGDS